MVAIASATAGEWELGLSDRPPESGPSIKTARGYLMPYTETIPGAGVTFQMVPIPGGKFLLGSPETEDGRNANEGPQVEVEVQPFWMGRCEVTWGEYKQYMALLEAFKKFEVKGLRKLDAKNEADAITAPSNLYDPTFSFAKGDSPRLPAVSMSQYAAKQYTKWLALTTGRVYRLPSEAEWEYACRAGTTTAYSFGDDPARLPEFGWAYDNSDDTPHEVGQKKPNPWGLYDMHGNVAEWCLDQLDPQGYALRTDKERRLAHGVEWPTKLSPRVIRGGSWDLEAKDCRSASRLGSQDREWQETDPNAPKSPWWFTDGMALSLGFRVVRPLDDPTPELRIKFWEADVQSIRDAVQARIDQGRGARGLVDRELSDAIKELRAPQ